MSEWISVKERLPETESPVLSFGYWGGGPQTAIGVYSPKFNTWYVIADIGTVAFVCITHWMPLPSPPGEECE